MCPKQVESTFYALVMAVINLGYLISYWIGGLLTIWFNVSSEDFSNFWILIVISSTWPLLTLFYLIVLPKESRLGLKNVQKQSESDLLRKPSEQENLLFSEEQGRIRITSKRRSYSMDDTSNTLILGEQLLV